MTAIPPDSMGVLLVSETPVNRNYKANIGQKLYVVGVCYKWILNPDNSTVMLPPDSECAAALYEKQSPLPHWDSHYFQFLSPFYGNFKGLQTPF